MRHKIILFLLLFTLLFSGLAEAKGYSSVPVLNMDQLKKNGESVYHYDSPVFPFLDPDLDRIQSFFRKMAEALNAIMIWDAKDKTISLIKPDVNMVTATMVGKKEDSMVIAGPFSKVRKGESLDRFYVYTEISNLPNENLELRLLIRTPGSKEKGEFTVQPGIVKNHGEDAWINFQVNHADFSQAGKYTIQLQMKVPSLGSTFYTIGEKTIDAR